MRKIILSLAVLSFFAAGFAASGEKMEYEKEYLPRIQKAQDRLKKAEEDVKAEEAKLEASKTKNADLEAKIAQAWTDIYTMIQSDKAGVDAFRNELNAFDKDIKTFGALPAEELFKRKAELDQMDVKLKNFRADKRSALTEFYNKLNNMEQTIKSIRSSIVVPYVTSYTVTKGDNLWKISGKKDIYDDPFKWPTIYKNNKETIQKWQKKYNAQLKEGQREEDLIYPDQEFTIPR